MQQAAVEPLAEDENAEVGPPSRSPTAFVPCGGANKIKFTQAARGRLTEHLMGQKLPRAVAMVGLIVTGLGEVITPAKVQTKVRGDRLSVQLKDFKREISISLRRLRHRIIKLARAWITLD